MEHSENSTASPKRLVLHAQSTGEDKSDGNAYLYILIVMSFYGVFLCAIMLGYFRSKRREKRRVNIFTRLVHEEEQREWGALPKKHSLSCPAAASGLRSMQVSLPFYNNHGGHFGNLHYESALACVLCTEQSSISSLCSSADTRLTIEEESDSGTAEGPAEGPEESAKPGTENSGDDSGWTSPIPKEKKHHHEKRSGCPLTSYYQRSLKQPNINYPSHHYSWYE